MHFKQFLEKMRLNRKGQVFDNIIGMAIGLVVLAITLVVVFLILSQTRTNTTVAADQNATNALIAVQNAGSSIPNWVPIVVIVVIGSILISLVMRFMSGRQ